MKQTLVMLLLLLAVPAASAQGDAPAPQPRDERLLQPAPETRERFRVYDISLHAPQELRRLLQRLDELADSPNPSTRPVDIALVLHGPEVGFFAIDNYAEYRDIVDLAARLDAFGVIEVKACRARMRDLGLTEADLPPFIETVPFGPGEVERLEQEGYVRM